MVILCLQSYTFCLEFIIYLPVWIQIQFGSETGSTTLVLISTGIIRF